VGVCRGSEQRQSTPGGLLQARQEDHSTPAVASFEQATATIVGLGLFRVTVVSICVLAFFVHSCVCLFLSEQQITSMSGIFIYIDFSLTIVCWSDLGCIFVYSFGRHNALQDED
jgi:hypothetical protein